MRTSKEYRKWAGELDAEGRPNSAEWVRDAADLIDAVAWWASKFGMASVQPFDAYRLLAAYRASLRPAKPASGCEGCAFCRPFDNVNNLAVCAGCTRMARNDRWEAQP